MIYSQDKALNWTSTRCQYMGIFWKLV
jgi:hypothetical protein